MSKTIKSYLSISIVLAILGLAIISDSKPVGPVVEVYGQQQCKHLNAECFWNSSGHNCCPGLACEEWKVTGGTQRYKCGPGSTPTPTTTPTAGPTTTPTSSSTPTPTSWPTSTSTPTTTPTAGPTITPTVTSTPGPTITPTVTSTPTPTGRPTSTPTTTPTAGPTITPTVTSTPGPTITPTVTSTPTPTGTEEMTGTPVPTATNVPSSNNDGSTTNNNGNPGSPVCNDADPGVPGNLRATALGGGKVRLNWNDSSGPHQSYAVAYGPNRDSFIYGDPNVGNVTSYVVSALNPGGNYCFYVQAQNGCRGGSPSNIVCTNQAGGVRVLGTSDNYNPLVDGIKESYGGEVLGASTELMGTAEVVYSKGKLPSGNTLDLDHSIIIPKIGVNFPIYRPQQIGDMLTVGHKEVLLTTIDGRKVYYGHNGSDVFGGLFQLRVGDQIKTIDEGIENKYEVTETRLVNKTEVESLKAESDQIVLVTCSFTKPEFRIIVKASIK